MQQQRKAFDPNQPRVPAGNPDGGEWTRGGGLVRVAQVGGIGHNQGPPVDTPPEIPKERPASAKERNAVVKRVAKWLLRAGGPAGAIVQVGSWVYDDIAAIEAYRDPPKSFEELQQGVADRKWGYDVHHIVEQTPAERDGYPRDMIDGPNNLVRIPRLKHWEINGWYQQANDRFGGLSPREYLRDKDWAERTRVGRDALAQHGVLRR